MLLEIIDLLFIHSIIIVFYYIGTGVAHIIGWRQNSSVYNDIEIIIVNTHSPTKHTYFLFSFFFPPL